MTTFMGVFTVLQPLCPNIGLFYFSLYMASVGSGAWDSADAIWLVEIWKDKSPPYLNLAQCAYGVGSIIAPLIAEPYLIGELKSIKEISIKRIFQKIKNIFLIFKNSILNYNN